MTQHGDRNGRHLLRQLCVVVHILTMLIRRSNVVLLSCCHSDSDFSYLVYTYKLILQLNNRCLSNTMLTYLPNIWPINFVLWHFCWQPFFTANQRLPMLSVCVCMCVCQNRHHATLWLIHKDKSTREDIYFIYMHVHSFDIMWKAIQKCCHDSFAKLIWPKRGEIFHQARTV